MIKITLLSVCAFLCASFFVQVSTTGVASYYSNKFHLRRTASGEVYHKDSLTAAHRKLPFGTLLKVTNLKNDSVVVVKVNDRLGNGHRIVDLSYAAAEQLNFIRAGLAKVQVEILENEVMLD